MATTEVEINRTSVNSDNVFPIILNVKGVRVDWSLQEVIWQYLDEILLAKFNRS